MGVSVSNQSVVTNAITNKLSELIKQTTVNQSADSGGYNTTDIESGGNINVKHTKFDQNIDASIKAQ